LTDTVGGLRRFLGRRPLLSLLFCIVAVIDTLRIIDVVADLFRDLPAFESLYHSSTSYEIAGRNVASWICIALIITRASMNATVRVKACIFVTYICHGAARNTWIWNKKWFRNRRDVAQGEKREEAILVYELSIYSLTTWFVHPIEEAYPFSTA
jgi:hypothetical protein